MSQSNRTTTVQASRRSLMTAGAGLMAAALPIAAAARAPAAAKPARASAGKSTTGSGYVTVQDGAQIFYKDWGPGPPSRSSSTTADR